MPGRVGHALTALVPAGRSILLGLSGGVDSVVLLHLLAALAPSRAWKLSALHVHHGISPRAGEWAAFCAALCEAHGIPLKIERVDIGPLREKGIEAAARELRHAALMRQPVDFVALAHHQDDQAETLLLQLMRGAGVKGAAAMPYVKQAAQQAGAPALLRPLLDFSRAELLAYAERNGLRWVDDESNADETYPRNYLRHRILPLLEQRFPACHATLARSAQHFAEAALLLDALAEQDAVAAFDGETLSVGRLAELDAARAKNLLRWFLHWRGALLPDATRLHEMLRQLSRARADAQVCVAWSGWELRRYRGRIYAERSVHAREPAFFAAWHGEDRLDLPQLGGALCFVRCTGEGLSLAKLHGGTVTLRVRHGEERLRPDATRPVRSLQYLFQAAGIPPWRRARWPLVYCADELVAVPGVGIENRYRAAPGEAGVAVTWLC